MLKGNQLLTATAFAEKIEKLMFTSDQDDPMTSFFE